MSALREAAFGRRPDLGVRVEPGTGAVDRWLVAVTLGGQGRYAAAATELGRLLADPAVPPAVAAHAAVTRAAHRRQQGGHAAARPDDALGLRLATAGPAGDPDADGTDAWAARIDALVGLAADAVGLGDPTTAARLLDVAERAAEGHPSWRPRVRLGWVRAEHALLTGRAADAVSRAGSAVALAVAGGSVRHVLKSRIIHVVARGVAGDVGPADAIAALDAIGEDCDVLGLLPLRWPCALAAADLVTRLVDDHESLANDSVARSAQRSPDDRSGGATRRRHAAASAMSVIGRRADPRGKRLLGVSV